MKKLALLMVVLFSFSCSNPSMDEGFSKLEQSLAELGAAIEALNIPQMQANLESMNAMAEQMIIDAEAAQGAFDAALNDLAYVNAMLDEMVADSANWATSEQMQELLDQAEQFNHDVETLTLAADYDLDGVINARDKCPNTELGAVVNVLGCAEGQTPITD